MAIWTRIREIPQALRPAAIGGWARRAGRRRGILGFLAREAATLYLAISSLKGEEIPLRAAALTYRTLLALVPTLAVAFALFGAFGGLDRLRDPLKELVLQNLAVGRSEEVGAWLDRFISNVHAGAIAGVGVIGLAYTAVGLLTDIETSVNRLWGVREGRPFVLRFGLYWSLITLAPPFIAYSISLSARFQSSQFATEVLEWLPFGLAGTLLGLTSVLAVCVAFAITYLAVPNARVRLSAAVAGGLVAGVAWSGLKSLFISFVASSVQYNAVYGALGALPLLMLWLYFSWMVVLFGARLAFVHQSITLEGFADPLGEPGPMARDRLALRLALEVARDFAEGRRAPGLRVLAERVGVLPPLARRLLQTLTDSGVLAMTAGRDPGYVPGRDPRSIALDGVIDAFRDRPVAPDDGDDGACRLVDRTVSEADAAARRVLAAVRMSDLVAPPDR